ncbi:DEAD/DEAH box helicase [Thermoplasmatota archaeon]
MQTKYINYKKIKLKKIEFREYQVNIAESSFKKNTLLVLPTGLGKTVIALILISKIIQICKKEEKILFLAPTKPLVLQHAKFLKESLEIDCESISIFTGEISPEERNKLWARSKIIISTPQVVENDLLSKKIDIKDVSFVIFDEAHHAVGKYSYVFISEMYKKHRVDGYILGMTASPGNEIPKIKEICKNLNIKNIEIRTKYDSDVKPYIYNLEVIWKEVFLPKEFSYTIQLLRKSLSNRLKFLKEFKFIDSASVARINRTKLLDAQIKIQKEIKSRVKIPKLLFQAASIQSEALKLYFAIELLQTQGVNALNNYFQRMNKEVLTKNSTKSSKSIMSDQNISEAVAYVKSLDIEHPKLQEIINIVEKQLSKAPNSKIIIFTHYRDTSLKVFDILKNIDNYKPVRFIGQAGKDKDKGLTQRQQADIISKFKNGEFNILIATSVAEEGLDIPSTELVVFFEPIPSEIRNIQRRGRTARKMSGKVIILITKGTPDEGYYWASKRREKHMKSELELLRSKIDNKTHTDFFNYDNIDNINNQSTLKDYEKNNQEIKIIIDHREYRSRVVRNLMELGISIESQQLAVGDYILSSRIGVERKNVDDFLNSLINGKLFSQISKLRDAYSRPMLIIEGEGLLTKRNIKHNAIFGSLVSIMIDYGIPIFTTKDDIETANILSLAAKREQKKDKKSVSIRGEKTSMSIQEQQQFIVEGLPNVSSILAKRLLSKFGSIKSIINATENELQDVNGVGKNIALKIIEILNSEFDK